MRIPVDYRQESRESYKAFLKERTEYKKTLSYSDFQSIVKEFNYLLRDYILETGKSINLPHGLGKIYVCKKKFGMEVRYDADGKPFIFQKRIVDPVASKREGKRIYFENNHTGGYVYEVYWDKRFSKLPFKKVFRYKNSRLTSRLLAHYIKNTDCSKRYTAVKYKDIP